MSRGETDRHVHATALICDAQQRFTLESVTLPDPSPRQIAVRACYTGVSVGTEFALIKGKLSWGPYPLCTGYMGAGVVEAIGADVQGFSVGDTVYYRRNEQMTLADGRTVSCVSGGHCSHAVLDPATDYGVDHVPAGVPLDAASLFVTPAVGLNGVDMANPRLGEIVVVHGVGLIGLGVVAACANRGCLVIAVDLQESHLAVARQLGADHLIDASRQNVAAEVKRIAPDGADIVFECTGLPSCLDLAIPLCRAHGRFVWQGNYGAAPVSLQFLPAHSRRLQMFFPCDDGLRPCRRAVLKNMASGALNWRATITHRVAYNEAPGLFDRINRGLEPDLVGAVVRWSE